jgi:hypothetical protein
MATVYISSAQGDNTTGGAWSTAYTSLDDGTVTFTTGDVVYVDSAHSDDMSAANYIILTATSDYDNPVTFISVTYPGSDVAPTSYARGATITTTNNRDISFSGNAGPMVFIGFDFTSINNISVATNTFVKFIDCKFTITTSSGADYIGVNNDSAAAYFENCVFKYVNSAQGFISGRASRAEFVNCSIDATGTAITTFFEIIGENAFASAVGCDFSHATNLVDDLDAPASGSGGSFFFNKTKFGSGDVVVGGIDIGQARVECYGVSSGTTHYDVHVEDFMGTTNEDINIYRSATYDGTNGYSLKTVSTGDGKPGYIGHRYHLCDVWASANSTFDVEFMTTDATTAATLDTSEFWIEVIQPDSTGPLGTHTSTADSDYGLGTPTALTAGDSGAGDWTGELADTNYYKCSVTVSGGTAGVHSIWVNVATSSAKTVYVDPHVDVT